jgi:hypothetical protein
LLIRDKIDHAIRHHDIGGVVGDWQVFQFAEAELNIARADAELAVTHHLFDLSIFHACPYAVAVVERISKFPRWDAGSGALIAGRQ